MLVMDIYVTYSMICAANNACDICLYQVSTQTDMVVPTKLYIRKRLDDLKL